MKGLRSVLALAVCLALAGCSQTASLSEDGAQQSATGDSSEEIILPTGKEGYRKISEELPKPAAKVENPGTREHFTFPYEGRTYVFTETETLWLYNQAKVYELQTQFLLNVKGHKIGIVLPEEVPKLDKYIIAYEDDAVTIYRQQEGAVGEQEQMYLKVYDMVYQIQNWTELVNKRTISVDKLCQELAQMGTAIVPAEKGETLTDIMTGLRMTPVMDGYVLAHREGISESGFLCCSPSANEANHDKVSIYLSVQVPDWDTYAILHVEEIPDYRERLENTGETYDGYPILVDYTGELKYFLLGEDGRCIYLDGVPETKEENVRSYTAKEAAYIFELVLTK